MKVIEGHKLFKDTYLIALDTCLAVVKVNDKGEIVKVSTFGEKREEA